MCTFQLLEFLTTLLLPLLLIILTQFQLLLGHLHRREGITSRHAVTHALFAQRIFVTPDVFLLDFREDTDIALGRLAVGSGIPGLARVQTLLPLPLLCFLCFCFRVLQCLTDGLLIRRRDELQMARLINEWRIIIIIIQLY
jgi:hypothetical protein